MNEARSPSEEVLSSSSPFTVCEIPPVTKTGIQLPYKAIFLSGWALTSLYMLIFVLISYTRLWKTVRKGKVIYKGPIHDLYKKCLAIVDLNSTPQLVVAGKGIRFPFFLGIFEKNRTIVIPRGFVKTKNKQELAVILCHELHHIKNKDHIINLLRTIGLILFHFHPVRLVTDYFINKFQEINSDLQTVKKLELNSKEYASLMIKFLPKLGYSINPTPLQTPFLVSNASFLKRVLYVKEHVPVNQSVGWIANLLCLVILFTAGFVNPGIVTAQANVVPLLITGDQNVYNFPTPLSEQQSLLTELLPIIEVQDDRVWILQKNKGLFVYQMDGIVPEPLFDYPVYQNEVPVVFSDFTMHNGYVYLGVTNADGFSFEGSHIDVLQITNNGLTRVGTIEHNFPITLEIFGGNLWVSGSGDDPFIGGSVSIYSLQDPAKPVEVDWSYQENIPSYMKVSPDGSELVILYGQNATIYRNSASLTPAQDMTFDSILREVHYLKNDTLIILGVRFGGASIQESILVLEQGPNTQYTNTFAYNITFAEEFRQRNLMTGTVYPIGNHKFILSFIFSGASILELGENGLTLQTFVDKPYSYFFEHNGFIFAMNDVMSVFNATDFNRTSVNEWGAHEIAIGP